MKKLLFLLLTSVPVSVFAHPHVFIKPELKIVQNIGSNELEITWELDAFFSASIIAENNSRNDGSFTNNEIVSIRQNYFDNLKNFGYLMVINIDGKPFNDLAVSSFHPSRHGQSVVYQFRIKLPPRSFQYKLEVIPFDKSGYVAFEDLPKNAPGLETKTLKSDYFGSVEVQAEVFTITPTKWGRGE